MLTKEEQEGYQILARRVVEGVTERVSDVSQEVCSLQVPLALRP